MTTVPTKEQYERMLQEANGICPACGREPRNKEIGLILYHNHITSRWVGLLFPHCNAALGYMDDSSILLRRLHEHALRMAMQALPDQSIL